MEGKIQERVNKIRKRMKEEHLDAWIIVSDDYHASEYVGTYFKCRQYVSGFTGSAGTLVIMQEEAGLWTDGRYFIQAEQELAGSGITLYRMEEDGVPSLEEFLEFQVHEHGSIGVDGRTISTDSYRKLYQKLESKQAVIRLDLDLAGEIWQDRPRMSCESAWELDISYCGKQREDKLLEIRKKLEEKKAGCTIISSLDDIAWTLNIRGNDVECTPVTLSFLIIRKNQAIWFVQKEAVSSQLEESLRRDGIILCDYWQFYQFLSEELDEEIVYLDPARTNILISETLKKSGTNRKIIEGTELTLLPKAVKNTVEVKNMRQAHIKDAVACTKFIYWLKTNIGKQPVTELSAVKKLEEFRQMQEHYVGASFQTISGYAEHGALPHYSATKESDAELKENSFLLVDSGGHYLEGTTDITRTIALGPLTEQQKHHYTLVLKGNIRLAAAKFKYGCAGIQLDYLAREALYKEGLDYNHGTGHGVGYLLSVHEPPNSIRCKISAGKEECIKLEEGMITSDEPGLYLEGSYGIRIEDLIVCKKLEKNAYGQFMGFEKLSLVPYEREAIIREELTEEERLLINKYHAKVLRTIGPLLDEEERRWLEIVTAEL